MYQKLLFRAVLFIFYLHAVPALAQTGIENYQSGFQGKGNEVYFTNSGGDVGLEFCTPDMSRVRASWDKQFLPNEPYMVVKYDWPEVQLQTSEQNDHVLLITDRLHVRVLKAPSRIEVSTADGKLLSTDALAGTIGSLAKQGEAVQV